MSLSTPQSQLDEDRDRIVDSNDDEVLFCDEDEETAPQTTDILQTETAGATETEVWKVIIVDDEPSVHRATQLALKNFRFEDKPLSFYSAYSAEEAKQLISIDHPDTTFILLDVVMETNDAGLRVVRYIREELKNQHVRIILRTGHPGEAPEESVIVNYDINDYKLKVELTRQRMVTTAIAALRSYRDIITIEKQKQELTQALEHLQQTQNQLEEYAYMLEMKVAERTVALEKANQELYLLANLDGLTGVANRRCFDEYWQKQWQLLAEQQQPLSLILIDIDYFKNYNDRYGHQAGDECLQIVARTISNVLKRPTDLVARYGGEEFAIALPNTPLAGAQQIVQAIASEIGKLNLEHTHSPISNHITLSLGISCTIPNPNTSWKSAIAIADKALYQAKEDGRNRYCVFGEPSMPLVP
ncbi:diguanylate cyclase domain-containing protein [Pseudanabaena sp. PCC 6802]|uniref:diguanylate cyclase domain-containing protein n=1 Tax=Pseudanabaena sp. PCC 6802 TaxID=118173 RepID=UPI000374ACE2|nr:diguanylate cyclase [Pseudanabaena sp. PCC 6802]